ncbi:hypothetical protein [Burkholderia ubonensis]|uniref:hypothetical protein n=1 Tax=Burkholderia ubonensis TaxID=101571 RepID=UPI0012FAA797|nr:hypothetical protein [Burkholderia ubonensis]
MTKSVSIVCERIGFASVDAHRRRSGSGAGPLHSDIGRLREFLEGRRRPIVLPALSGGRSRRRARFGGRLADRNPAADRPATCKLLPFLTVAAWCKPPSARH